MRQGDARRRKPDENSRIPKSCWYGPTTTVRTGPADSTRGLCVPPYRTSEIHWTQLREIQNIQFEMRPRERDRTFNYVRQTSRVAKKIPSNVATRILSHRYVYPIEVLVSGLRDRGSK